MSYQWKVGELAKCVCDTGYRSHDKPPKKDRIYTVRMFWNRNGPKVATLWFNELRNGPETDFPDYVWNGEAGYPSDDFRPLDDSDLEAIREKYKDEVPTAPKVRTE